MPVALISTITSPALGPASCTVVTSSGLPAATATAARTSMGVLLVGSFSTIQGVLRPRKSDETDRGPLPISLPTGRASRARRSDINCKAGLPIATDGGAIRGFPAGGTMTGPGGVPIEAQGVALAGGVRLLLRIGAGDFARSIRHPEASMMP